jgi:L-rhamnose mutarotase
MMHRYCFALDLKNDPVLIAEYDLYHRNVWPEVQQSIIDSGIIQLDIYRVENRLFMILDSDDSFSLEKKAEMDNTNATVQEWENLMSRFQQSLPFAKAGEKWVLMKHVFHLNS